MPTDVYRRLSEEKRSRIYEALRDEFTRKPLGEASIKSIVETLGIARGSFYQYFEGLNDAYFTVLSKETVDMHGLWLDALRRKNGSMEGALQLFGKEAARALFEQRAYTVYKNRYLNWTAALESAWQKWQAAQQGAQEEGAQGFAAQMARDERSQFIKAVVHSLIRRLFAENWDRETFLAHYRQYIQWMMKGVMI